MKLKRKPLGKVAWKKRKVEVLLRNKEMGRERKAREAREEEAEAEADSALPGDIATQPDTKIVFNAPFRVKAICHIEVTNFSASRIGWAIKTTNKQRLGVDPTAGVLDPKENALIAVSCDAFVYGKEDTNNDRITIGWTNTPEGATKQFSREWFQGDGVVRRKKLTIEYNL